MMKILQYKYTLLYIILIPIVNIFLIYLPMFNLGNDIRFTPASLLIGFIYVTRDFSQRELGKKMVFIPMLIASLITYCLGAPEMATASLLAFAAGELTDWVVYTFTRKPLSQRIFISGLIAIPVDIIIVLIGLHFAIPGAIPINIYNMLIMFICNMSSVIIISLIVRNLEIKNIIANRIN